MTDTSTRSKLFIAAISVAFVLALPGSPAARTITTDPSRATRLREYRQMIVGLYRVSPATGDDPIEALKRALTTQYGERVESGLET